MAKKNYTPEEVQAKMEKKSNNRKVFFGTFTKALAVFLAVVIAWSLVVISFTAPSVGTGSAGIATNNNSTSTDGSGDSSGSAIDNDESMLPDDSALPEDPAGDATGDAGDAAGDADDSSAAKATAADVAKILNDATAKAKSGNYKWARKCWYTSPLDVGNATDTLNGIIHRVDENASLDSVVGGFLGITGKENEPGWEADVKAGKVPEETKMKDKHLLKAFALTEADIKDYRVNGDTYTVQLNAVKSPQKDGKNALNHITNDFITKDEVAQGVADGLGSLANLIKINSLDVDFTQILITAVVKDGALKSVKISYTMTVNELNLTATIATIKGKGAGKMECSYTF